MCRILGAPLTSASFMLSKMLLVICVLANHHYLWTIQLPRLNQYRKSYSSLFTISHQIWNSATCVSWHCYQELNWWPNSHATGFQTWVVIMNVTRFKMHFFCFTVKKRNLITVESSLKNERKFGKRWKTNKNFCGVLGTNDYFWTFSSKVITSLKPHQKDFVWTWVNNTLFGFFLVS